MMQFRKISNLVMVSLLVFQLGACAGTRGGLSETWTLVQIVTQGEHTDVFSDVVTVQNCGILQPKTVSCSAGTTSDLSFTLGGGVTLGAGANISIEGSVSQGLGIGRSSGESVELETPPSGSVYIYTVDKEYRVNTGEMVAQSSSGDQQTVSYNFNASCSIQVVDRAEASCSSLNSGAIDMPGENWSTDIQETHIYEQHAISEMEFTNYTYEADVRINDDSSEYHGLMFGLQTNDNNFYSFRITPDGYFALDLWQDDPEYSFTRLLGPSSSSAISTGIGQVNRLRVTVTGSRFDLYINNVQVGTIMDETFSTGRVGYVSCTCDGSNSASATFLNAVVSQR